MLKKSDASQQALKYVERVHGALENFRRDSVNAEGVLNNPSFRTSQLRVARDEINRAIAILETTKW